jgi:hypothetical protein
MSTTVADIIGAFADAVGDDSVFAENQAAGWARSAVRLCANTLPSQFCYRVTGLTSCRATAESEVEPTADGIADLDLDSKWGELLLTAMCYQAARAGMSITGELNFGSRTVGGNTASVSGIPAQHRQNAEWWRQRFGEVAAALRGANTFAYRAV